MAGGGRRVRVTRLDETSSIGGRDSGAVEEPLEVRVDGEVLATTMRTPGDDFDLALGFAILDGGVDPSRVGGMSYCGVDAGEQVEGRVVPARVRAQPLPAWPEPPAEP